MPPIQIWQVAAGLGVGAFLAVIFYGIVKHFGTEKGKGIETSKLGKEATAIIAVLIVLIGGAITIVGLVLYAPDKNSPEPDPPVVVPEPPDPDPDPVPPKPPEPIRGDKIVRAESREWEDIVSIEKGRSATLHISIDGAADSWRWGGDSNPGGLAGSAHPADDKFPAPGVGVGSLIMEKTEHGTTNITGFVEFGSPVNLKGPGTIRMKINDHDFAGNSGKAKVTFIIK